MKNLGKLFIRLARKCTYKLVFFVLQKFRQVTLGLPLAQGNENACHRFTFAHCFTNFSGCFVIKKLHNIFDNRGHADRRSITQLLKAALPLYRHRNCLGIAEIRINNFLMVAHGENARRCDFFAVVENAHEGMRIPRIAVFVVDLQGGFHGLLHVRAIGHGCRAQELDIGIRLIS